MQRLIFLTTLSILSISLLSCASYMKRKECEKVNWHEYGKKVAMEGKRLSSDKFIKECEAAEAVVKHDELDIGFKEGMNQYCQKDTAYKIGREGNDFNFRFCHRDIENLKASHAKGLKDYCTPEGGYQAGSKGKTYRNNCPKDVEAAFLKKYRHGRSIFLQGEIRKKEREVIDIEDQIRRKEREQRNLQYQLTSLPKARVIRQERTRDKKRTSTDIYIEDVDTEANQAERQRLKRLIRNLGRDITRLEDRRRQLRIEIVDTRTEINSLRAY